MIEKRYFNIHNKIKILVEGSRKKMLPIYNDLKFFEVHPPEIDFDKEDIYINLNLGDVNKPLKSKTINYPHGKTVLYKGDNNFYVEDQYKVVKWKTIFEFNQDSINVSFNGGIFSDYFLKLYILQPLLRFIAPEHGLIPFHCSMIERDKKAYVLSAFKGCQPAGSKVLMADGSWKNIEEIKVGDLVLSPQNDGTYIFSPVTDTCSWNSSENYTVQEQRRNKKELYRCSYNHIVPINKRSHPKFKKSKYEVIHLCAKQLADTTYMRSAPHNMTGFTSPEIPKFFGRENCKIEPYTIGVWLGDGHFTKSGLGITTTQKVIIEELSKHYKMINIYPDNRNPKVKTYRFSSRGKLGKQLKEYGLFCKRSGDKFIPKEALLSDSKYRKKLLAGLIDSDGYRDKNKLYSISTKSEQLANDISDLVYSLGGRVSIKKVRKRIKKLGFEGEYFNVSFYLGKAIKEVPIKIGRKKRTDDKFFYLSSNRIAIEATRCKPSKVYGFTILSPSSWYITDNWCVTHNTGKTSTLINALYDGCTNYMSDDLGFVDKETAYAYPTPIHLYSYNLKHFPEIKHDLTLSKRFEFFVKSVIFKTSNNYVSFPTDVDADLMHKDITGTAPLGKIINLLKTEEEDIVDFLVKTNEYEMFRFVDYIKYFDNDMMIDYTEKMRELYKSLEDKMVNFVLGNEYRNDTYEKIKELMK